MKRYIIISGETSGDIYGSSLMKQMKKTHHGDIAFWGIGGDKMYNEGLYPLGHSDNISVVGFTEIIKKIPSINNLLNNIARCTNEIQPDGVILIDFPGFNIRLAKRLKKKYKIPFPIIYFISPQIWAWHESRIKLIKKYIDKMLVIFPFEESFYKQYNVDATYVGHPFLDEWSPANTNQQKNQLGFNPKKKLISIFPGSRLMEIKQHLPVYIKSIEKIKNENENCEFALGLAPGFDKKEIEKTYNMRDIQIIDQEPLQLLECSHAAIVTSGTVSLQASLMGVPCVVGYKLSFLSWLLSKILIKVKFISMTNIMVNKMLIREYTQYQMTPKNIAQEINKLINNSQYYSEVQENLLSVKNLFLNKERVMENVTHIINLMDNEKN